MSLYGYTYGGESVKGKMLVTQTKEFDFQSGKNNTKNYNIGDVVSVDVSKTTLDRGDYFIPQYFIDGIKVREGNEFKFIEKNPYKDFEHLYKKEVIQKTIESLKSKGEDTTLQELKLRNLEKTKKSQTLHEGKKWLVYGLIAVAGYLAYKKFKK